VKRRKFLSNIKNMLITTKLLDFVHRPDFYKQKTQRFGNWICFRLQAQKLSSNECYTPSSEPFRMY
jgi:hypothetical protein